MEKFISFLKKAKANTYASESARKVSSLRPGSKDYEYFEGEYLYHDTYFGGKNFIGEEIIYQNNKPIWAMNYTGNVISFDFTETELDKFLREVFKKDCLDIIPVRGPESYINNNMEYRNEVRGDINSFEGEEKIFKDGKLIYRGIFHGGIIN